MDRGLNIRDQIRTNSNSFRIGSNIRKPYCVNSRLPGPFIRPFGFFTFSFSLLFIKLQISAAALFPCSTPFYAITFQRRFPGKGAASQNDPFAQTRQPRARTLYFYSRMDQPSITQWTCSYNMACSPLSSSSFPAFTRSKTIDPSSLICISLCQKSKASDKPSASCRSFSV